MRGTLFTVAELVDQGIVLLPCPFCGEHDWLQLVDDGVYWPKIECTNCGARMEGESRTGVSAAWNQRRRRRQRRRDRLLAFVLRQWDEDDRHGRKRRTRRTLWAQWNEANPQDRYETESGFHKAYREARGS